MDTLHHGIMSLSWMNDQNMPDDAIDAILPWTMMPDVVQALYGKKMRAYVHMESDPNCQGQLHDMRVADFSKLFLSPECPVLRPPYGCAARVGVFMHYLQDQLYDEWIDTFIKQVSNPDGTYTYYSRMGDKPELGTLDVLDLKRWSWIEGLRYTYEKMDSNLNPALSLDWTQKHILDRIKDNPYWHPAMSAYAKHYHKIALSTDGKMPKVFAPWSDEVYQILHEAIDDWECLILGGLRTANE